MALVEDTERGSRDARASRIVSLYETFQGFDQGDGVAESKRLSCDQRVLDGGVPFGMTGAAGPRNDVRLRRKDGPLAARPPERRYAEVR